jgi:prepilin-type N-terminal cleavage/methylation domain-containing protein
MALVRPKQGFTLVEIMVTVMIIGIIMSIATPQLLRSNRKAREAQLKADLKMVRDALEISQGDLNTYAHPQELDDAVSSGQGWYGTQLGMGWQLRTYDLSKWKGPYLKKFHERNPINGQPYEWNSNPTDISHAFFCNVNEISTEGTNYRTW